MNYNQTKEKKTLKDMFFKFKYVYKKGWIKCLVLECLEKS